MTLAKLLRAVREDTELDEGSFVAYPRYRSVMREGVARGLLYSHPLSPNGAVQLTDRGIQWLRSHPLPRRRLRVIKVQR